MSELIDVGLCFSTLVIERWTRMLHRTSTDIVTLRPRATMKVVNVDLSLVYVHVCSAINQHSKHHLQKVGLGSNAETLMDDISFSDKIFVTVPTLSVVLKVIKVSGYGIILEVFKVGGFGINAQRLLLDPASLSEDLKRTSTMVISKHEASSH